MDSGHYSRYHIQLLCVPRLDSGRLRGGVGFLLLLVQWLWCWLDHLENVAGSWVCAVLDISRLRGVPLVLE